MKFAFFGTPDIAVIVLDELEKNGFIPSLVVTNPDAPFGRKHTLTPPPAKAWAEARGVAVFQPVSLSQNDGHPMTAIFDTKAEWDLFIVAAYGKLMPAWLLNLPKHGTINVHPSLLPALRGASPIRSAILGDVRETGATIMQMDAELDHGPILAQVPANISESKWPLRGRELDRHLASLGGQLLVETIPRWLNGEVTPIEQNHDQATFCTKITKDMSELTLDPHQLPAGDEAYQMLLKIRAFDGWPETFFIHEGKRIKIKDAELADNETLRITRIIPEGKSEMGFDSYFK
ncbi:hypothetical protein A2592_02915 [Candidatus Kaiserbacteria bacterium RIFOXYD1_FULL_42_15]|uniref:methionyl-tRNA formyltransferase n=1 Tax=Candidatus Kaiserbacteria bacterium RIFOXYD1_FULL_42_15 TaxID=1798532 RepID=A0A1F6FTY2_9BACT|nr:MAG: hypothetical protein A2592_02915 [Candidatus Kaiserbacteria bacterium RIFOXYD1_FULL_42_15]